MARKFWLEEIATAFGMTIKEFAAAIGYSRQSLYQANYGSIKLNKGRFMLAKYRLEDISTKMMEAEKAHAEERHQHRLKLIEELMDRFAGAVKDEKTAD